MKLKEYLLRVKQKRILSEVVFKNLEGYKAYYSQALKQNDPNKGVVVFYRNFAISLNSKEIKRLFNGDYR